MKNNILLIEDDASIRESIGTLLSGEGFSVTEAENGFEGLKYINEGTHLVILDIMMPGISGILTCKEIRKKSDVPILFLTAKDQEADKLIGFQAGGDDYLVKPFSYAELVARSRALIRRYRRSEQKEPGFSASEWIEYGKIRIHLKRNEIFKNGEEIRLTEIEYQILLLLMRHPSKIFSLQNIYESVWDEPYSFNSANTVMVHIRRIRTKLEDDPQKPEIIKTVWGKGYRFEKISM